MFNWDYQGVISVTLMGILKVGVVRYGKVGGCAISIMGMGRRCQIRAVYPR